MAGNEKTFDGNCLIRIRNSLFRYVDGMEQENDQVCVEQLVKHLYINILGEILVADGGNKRVLRLNKYGAITGVLTVGPQEKTVKNFPFVSLVAFDDDHVAVGYVVESGELVTEWYNMQDISAIREVRAALKMTKINYSPLGAVLRRILVHSRGTLSLQLIYPGGTPATIEKLDLLVLKVKVENKIAVLRLSNGIQCFRLCRDTSENVSLAFSQICPEGPPAHRPLGAYLTEGSGYIF